MDTASIVMTQLKLMFSNKINTFFEQFKHNLNNLNQFQIGVLSALLTLISMQFVYTVFIINSSFILFVFDLLQLVLITFSIFSFYTWFTIICGRKWSDTSIYLLFLSCFLSEFMIQIFTNDKSNQKVSARSIDLKHSNIVYLSTSLAQSIFISLICTMANFFLNSKISNNFLFILTLCVTRLCGSIYLSNIIPLALNAYFSYLCALSGVLFSHFIIKLVNDLNNQIRLEINDEIINQKMSENYLFKTTPNTHAAINNTKQIKTRRKFCSNSFDSFKRRTSLPSIPLKSDKINSGNGYLDEILNIIDEIFNNKKDISIDFLYEHLESIRLIINNAKMNTKCNESSKPLVNNYLQTISSNLKAANKPKLLTPFGSLSNNELKNSIDWNKLHSNSYSADEDEDKNSLSIFHATNQMTSKNRNRRSLPARSPSLAWSSTTTTASGMPNFENVSSKQRSSSLKTSGFINQNLLLNSCSMSKETLNDENMSSHSINIQSKPDQFKTKSNYDDEDEETTAASSLISNASNVNNRTSDYDSGESPNSSDYNSDTDKLQLKDLQYQYNNLSTSNKKLDEIKEENSDKLSWQVSEISSIELLDYLHDWNFPIFQLNDKSNNHILSKMAFKIFDRVGLFKSFDIPIDSFIFYFTELEKGYINLPYHNKIHAADVLHACYYLTTQPVPGFSQVDNHIKERHSLKHFHHSAKYRLNNDLYGSLGANFDPLELLALFCAASMHDYDHPGRNNQFLVSINSPLALLYNDRSVLENHHAAASWRLLRSNSKYNFLSGLDAAELKRFRHLVIENILATDLSKHFTIINDFNNLVKNKNGTSHMSSSPTGLDWKNESDRLTISKMIIKLADINSPLKERELHLQWSERICEEFYQQGEEEESLGFPISSFMDRKNPQVAKLQENFMSGLVGPLSEAYATAGLLPGILIEDSQMTEELNDSDIELTMNTNYKKAKNTKIFYSELTSNFKTNYAMWCELLKKEQK